MHYGQTRVYIDNWIWPKRYWTGRSLRNVAYLRSKTQLYPCQIHKLSNNHYLFVSFLAFYIFLAGKFITQRILPFNQLIRSVIIQIIFRGPLGRYNQWYIEGSAFSLSWSYRVPIHGCEYPLKIWEEQPIAITLTWSILYRTSPSNLFSFRIRVKFAKTFLFPNNILKSLTWHNRVPTKHKAKRYPPGQTRWWMSKERISL